MLERWVNAGLLGPEDARRVRAWETERNRAHGPGWPVLLALGFGALLLSAGILLFVAAHWDALSPVARFSLLLALVALFHVAGAASIGRSPALATALHAIGSVALGGGIYLTAQIFNLHEHWPTGVMLWALGAGAGVVLLRDWPQVTLLALLLPAWLASEHMAQIRSQWGDNLVLAQSLFLLAVVYVSARTPACHSVTHQAIATVGTVALVPTAIYLFSAMDDRAFIALHRRAGDSELLPAALGIALPVLASFLLRRRAGWTGLVAALWVFIAARFDVEKEMPLFWLLCWCTLGGGLFVALGIRDRVQSVERVGLLFIGVSSCGLLAWGNEHERIFAYPLCSALSLAVVAWGVRFPRRDAINLGVVLFGTTVTFFYFSSVMDRLGRSASLIGLGLLFLGGGFALERARRKLLRHAGSHP